MKKIICPADDWTCPYYKNGYCGMEEEEGCLPFNECECFDIVPEAEEIDYEESEE